MTSSGFDDDILSPGHVYWIPIPLDRSREVFEAELRERLEGLSSQDHIDLVVQVLAAVAEQLSPPPSDDVPALNLAAWALLAEPDGLDLRAFATLRVLRIGPETTEPECVDLVLADEPVFQVPKVEELETRSGDALCVRFRPMVEEHGEQLVHQVTAVLWPRPKQEMLYILSNLATDLVEAAEIGERLEELAAGLEGL